MLVNDLKGTVQGRGPFTVLSFSNLTSHGLAKAGKGGQSGGVGPHWVVGFTPGGALGAGA
jgi:hypothetical protein